MALWTSEFSEESAQDGKAQLCANYVQTEVPGCGEKFLRRAPSLARKIIFNEFFLPHVLSWAGFFIAFLIDNIW